MLENKIDTSNYRKTEQLTFKEKQAAFDKGFEICNDIFKRYTKWI